MYVNVAVAVGTFAVSSAINSRKLRRERKNHLNDITIMSTLLASQYKQIAFLCDKLDEADVEITEFDKIVYNNL